MSKENDEWLSSLSYVDVLTMFSGKPRLEKSMLELRKDYLKRQANKLKPVLVDEVNERCEVCGYNEKSILQIHHILPIHKGGDNARKNLIIVCPNCHKTLHSLYRTVSNKKKSYNFVDVFTKSKYTIDEQAILLEIVMKYIKYFGDVNYEYSAKVEKYGTDNNSTGG